MTPKQLADALNGAEYGREWDARVKSLEAQAKASGLVIASGESDDLLEFYGAFRDELGCYGGGTALVDAEGLLPAFAEVAGDKDECRRYFEREPTARAIEAVWDGDADGYAWTLKTDIPHEIFSIMEDGAGFSRGIVFALTDLAKASGDEVAA